VEREIRKLEIPNAFFWVQFACCRTAKPKQNVFHVPKCIADFAESLPEQIKDEIPSEFESQNYIFTYGCKPGDTLPAKSSFIPDLISFLTGNFEPVSGCTFLPDCFTKTVTNAFFENSTGATSRKLVIERQDTVYSQCIIFYVRDREYDA